MRGDLSSDVLPPNFSPGESSSEDTQLPLAEVNLIFLHPLPTVPNVTPHTLRPHMYASGIANAHRRDPGVAETPYPLCEREEHTTRSSGPNCGACQGFLWVRWE